MEDEYGPAPSLNVYDGGDVVVWYVRRSTDDLERYVGSYCAEGMLSPAQGYPWFPEHVGLSTVVDY